MRLWDLNTGSSVRFFTGHKVPFDACDESTTAYAQLARSCSTLSANQAKRASEKYLVPWGLRKKLLSLGAYFSGMSKFCGQSSTRIATDLDWWWKLWIIYNAIEKLTYYWKEWLKVHDYLSVLLWFHFFSITHSIVNECAALFCDRDKWFLEFWHSLIYISSYLPREPSILSRFLPTDVIWLLQVL